MTRLARWCLWLACASLVGAGLAQGAKAASPEQVEPALQSALKSVPLFSRPAADYPPPVSPSGQASMLRFGPPGVDRSRFKPADEADRIMNVVKIKYAVRQDGHEFCSRITGVPIRFNSQPMACAFWNTKRRECTIVTPPKTGYNYIGHELRHCFEGAFHD